MASIPASRFAGTLADLARPADLRALPLPAMHMVMAMRLCALFERAGREPLVELTARFASVTVARAVFDTAELVTIVWPEAYMVSRPCCLRMTPDERTLACAALRADREGFFRQIDGFIRPARHEALFTQITAAAAAIAEQTYRA